MRCPYSTSHGVEAVGATQTVAVEFGNALPQSSRLRYHRDPQTAAAFLFGRPDVVEWLAPGTKLFKWTQSIATPRGVSPWWQFLEARQLTNGVRCPGIRDLQEYAARLGVHDRDYARVRAAVTEQWNKMTNSVAIELVYGA